MAVQFRACNVKKYVSTQNVLRVSQTLSRLLENHETKNIHETGNWNNFLSKAHINANIKKSMEANSEVLTRPATGTTS
jgi:tripartite-type tricarboxylate transporter receptor subunit TctC